jgi:hypothetical protein
MAIMEWRTLLGDNHDVTTLSNITGETDPFASDDEIQTIRVRVDANRNGGVRDLYRLELTKVGVGADVTQPNPAYLTDIAGTQAEVNEGETLDLTVEVRDRYNDPKRGVRINESVTASEGTVNVTNASDEDGRVEIEYTAPSSPGTETITVEPDLNNNGTVEAYERVQFTIDVIGSTSDTRDNTEPPQFTSGPTANPDSVSQNDTFELTATLDNIGENRTGTDITSVTWSDNENNSGELRPSDGEFDQPNESVNNTIDTDGWSSGNHTVTVTGKDANGNTGRKNVTVNIQGASLPTDAVAFNDTNNNGRYDDDSNETTYTESEAAQLDNSSVNLVVKRNITVRKIQINTQSVRLKSNVKLSTNNELTLDVSKMINIEDGTLDSRNKITLKSSSSGINAQGATVESENEMKLTADGGNLNLADADVDSENKVTFSASGEINVQGATVESKNEMKLTADSGNLNLADADVDSENKVTFSASGEINAQGATVESKNEMKLTANGGNVNLSGGALTSNNKITLTASADIDLTDTELRAKNQIKATPASAGTLFVNDNGGTRADGGTYIEDQNGNEGEVRLQQGSVSGTPEKGSITE